MWIFLGEFPDFNEDLVKPPDFNFLTVSYNIIFLGHIILSRKVYVIF